MLDALDLEYITSNEDTSTGRKMLHVLAYTQTLTRTCMYKCAGGYSVTCRKTCKGANQGVRKVRKEVDTRVMRRDTQLIIFLVLTL